MRDAPPPTVTLEHVARAAGVSRATVSRVVTGSGPVSAETLTRVRAAAEALGYEADPVARALASGTGTRVVVAVTGTSDGILDCEYTARLVTAGARVCTPAGLGIAVRRLPLRAPGAELDALARDRTVGGVVLVNTTHELLAAVPRALRGRVVSIGVGSADVPSFDVDGAGAAAASVAHLLRSGRRRIAMVTGPPWLPCAQRPVEAYRAAVAAAGLEARTVPGGFDAAAGEAGAEEVLARWPDTDAVLAGCDEVALGVLAVLRRHGREVPGDVAVAGFDDVPVAGVTGLTTATHPVERIAGAAVRAVLARAPLTGSTAGETVFFPSELVLRRSA
ncbi:LacI family DNA-binding transcriptional regulator [Geodermatophilus sp. SYSU D01045]